MVILFKIGGWFLRNLRNAFFVFVVNYIIMIQIGYNLLGGYIWYFISGEKSDALELISKEFSRGTHNYLWAVTVPTGLGIPFVLIIYFTLFFLFILLSLIFSILSRKIPHDLGNKSIFVLIFSQWFLFLLFFSSAVSTYIKNGENLSFRGTIIYPAVYSFSPIVASLLFWLVVAWLKRRSTQKSGEQHNGDK